MDKEFRSRMQPGGNGWMPQMLLGMTVLVKIDQVWRWQGRGPSLQCRVNGGTGGHCGGSGMRLGAPAV
jgi:hypothetical protein